MTAKTTAPKTEKREVKTLYTETYVVVSYAEFTAPSKEIRK